MAAFCAGFALRGGVPSIASNDNNRRLAARCVLDEAPDTSAATKANVKARYRRLGAGEGLDLPSPPRHYSVPRLGLVVENVLRLSTPVELFERYGSVFASNYALMDQVLVGDLQAVLAMTRDADNFETQGILPIFQTMFGETPILHMDKPHHGPARRKLAPGFSAGVLPSYYPAILQRTEAFYEQIADTTERPLKMLPVYRKHHIAMMIECTTGISDAALIARCTSLFDQFNLIFITPQFGPLFDRALRARDELLDILATISRAAVVDKADNIGRLRELGQQLTTKSATEIALGEADMLQVLLAQSAFDMDDANAALNEVAVKEVCTSLMGLWFAGFSTTTVTSVSCLFELGLDYDILHRLRDEQRSVDALTYKDVCERMPLLESFVYEVIRLYPAGGGVLRRARTDIEVCGYRVPKGTIVYLSFDAAGRDPVAYPSPERIVLDRHVKQRGMTPVKMLGFGVPGSMHYCLGAQLSMVMMKTALATVIRKYDFRLVPGQERRYGVFPDVAPFSGVLVDSFERRYNVR